MKEKAAAKPLTVMILALLSIISLAFILHERKPIQDHLNMNYLTYKAAPYYFAEAQAEILEPYDCESGRCLKLFPASNQWLVNVKLENGQEKQAYVMRDVRKDKVGDTIEVAYAIPQDGCDTVDMLTATRLYYIEESSVMNTYRLLLVLAVTVLLGCGVYLVRLLK